MTLASWNSICDDAWYFCKLVTSDHIKLHVQSFVSLHLMFTIPCKIVYFTCKHSYSYSISVFTYFWMTSVVIWKRNYNWFRIILVNMNKVLLNQSSVQYQPTINKSLYICLYKHNFNACIFTASEHVHLYFVVNRLC